MSDKIAVKRHHSETLAARADAMATALGDGAKVERYPGGEGSYADTLRGTKGNVEITEAHKPHAESGTDSQIAVQVRGDDGASVILKSKGNIVEPDPRTAEPSPARDEATHAGGRYIGASGRAVAKVTP